MDAVRMGGGVTTVGEKLPELKLKGTPTFIVSTALATRDFQDVHHDRDLAQAKGSKDIFINILSDVKSISLRLGVPWYAYDTTVFTGEVAAVEDGVVEVDVVGNNSLGAHVTAKVKLTIGAEQ